MSHKPLTSLGVNPGTRFIGLAVIRDGDLRDWRILGFPGVWTTKKILTIRKAILPLIGRWSPDVVAIKAPHHSRTSPRLNRVIDSVVADCRYRKIPLRRYSIGDLKKKLSPMGISNKGILMEHLASEFPVLREDLETERKNRQPYYVLAFEAVGLAVLAYRSIEGPSRSKPT